MFSNDQKQFMDAQQASLGFAQKQTSHIEAGVYALRYPELNYAQLVPVDTSANEWSKSVTYYSMDSAGTAQWLNGNGADVPVVGTSIAQHETPVYSAGVGYGYGLEEVNHARMLNQNLPGEKAAAARRAYEQMCYNVAMTGDTAKGFEGLFNYTGVPQASAAADGTGSSALWSTKDGDLISRDVNAALIGLQTATKQTELADTVVLPIERLQTIASKRMPDLEMTVLDFIKKSNIYTAQTGQPLNIVGKRGMTTVGSGSTARMVAYRRSPEVLKMHIPMVHRFFPVQILNFQFTIPGMFRLGGLDWRLPKAGTYVDGI